MVVVGVVDADVSRPVVGSIIGVLLDMDMVGIYNVLEDPAAKPVPCPPLPVVSNNEKYLLYCTEHQLPSCSDDSRNGHLLAHTLNLNPLLVSYHSPHHCYLTVQKYFRIQLSTHALATITI